jgi:hypothetical protein
VTRSLLHRTQLAPWSAPAAVHASRALGAACPSRRVRLRLRAARAGGGTRPSALPGNGAARSWLTAA